MFALYICINFGLPEGASVHRHEFLRLKKPDMELIEFRLDLGWLQVFFFLGIGVVFNCNLFIACPTDCDTELQIGSDLAEFF